MLSDRFIMCQIFVIVLIDSQRQSGKQLPWASSWLLIGRFLRETQQQIVRQLETPTQTQGSVTRQQCLNKDLKLQQHHEGSAACGS